MKYRKCQYYIFDNKKYVKDQRTNELKEVLQDFSASGRENPFSKNKQQSLYLSSVYKYIGHKIHDEYKQTGVEQFLGFDAQTFRSEKRRKKIYWCSRYMEFAHLKDKTKHISYNESCHSSLCPCCNFFRSRMDLKNMICILEEFYKNPFNTSFPLIFLTLTVPNCANEELKQTLDRLNKAYNRLMKYKELEGAFVASSRSLEITYNDDGSAHPHLHILLVCCPDYFTGNKYLNRWQFLFLWQRAYGVHRFRDFSKWYAWYWSQFFCVPDRGKLRLAPWAPVDFITQIDVRRIKAPTHKEVSQALRQGLDFFQVARPILAALSEFIKYPFKPDNLLSGDITIDAERVFFLDSAMYHRRRWQVSGFFKEIAQQLKLPDPEDDNTELVQIAGLDLEQIEYFSGWWYNNGFGEYLRGERKTNEQKNFFRRFMGLPELPTR